MRFPTVILILHIFEKGPMYLLKRLIYCRLTGGTRLANFSFPSGRRKPQMPCGDKIWTRILSRVGSEEGTGDQRSPATFTHGGHPPRIGIFVEIGFLSASQQYLCFLFLGICQFSICIPCPHRCFGLPGGAADVRCPHFGIWEGRTLLFVSSAYFSTLLQLWFLFHF